METFVAEIEGRAVMSFRAENVRVAQKWIDTEVRPELMVLETEGRPLWDGKAKISVRAATVAEQLARMKLSVESSEEYGDAKPADTLVFLVPVADTNENVRNETDWAIRPRSEK